MRRKQENYWREGEYVESEYWIMEGISVNGMTRLSALGLVMHVYFISLLCDQEVDPPAHLDLYVVRLSGCIQ